MAPFGLSLMNFGNIVRKALQRSELPINDHEHLDLARDFGNDVISDMWYMVKADFRQARDTLTTVDGSDEYVLNKLYDGMVQNTLRGPTANPRVIQYKDPQEFFRITRNFRSAKGTPYLFTFGELSGVDQQLTTSPATIRVSSSLASKTVGTVSVANGSRRVTNAVANSFTVNDVGQRIQISGDSLSYLISVYIDDRNLDLSDPYRGQTQSGASYKLGDVGIHANIQGYVGGQMDSEDVLLDGSNWINTLKSFGVISSCSKSDLTGGRILFQNAAGTQTIATLAPGEFEVERQTIVFWRIPSSSEVLSYRFYMKHPTLRMDTDRLLFPTKYHTLMTYMTEALLRSWAGMPISDYLNRLIQEGREQFYNDANNTGLWAAIPQQEGAGISYGQPDIYSNIIDTDFIT